MLALALAVSSLVVPQAPTSRRSAVASAAAFAAGLAAPAASFATSIEDIAARSNAAAEEDRRDADLKEAEEEARVKQLTAILAIAILPLPYLGITGAQKAISDAAMLSGDDEGAVRGALRGKDPRSANFQQKRRR